MVSGRHFVHVDHRTTSATRTFNKGSGVLFAPSFRRSAAGRHDGFGGNLERPGAFALYLS